MIILIYGASHTGKTCLAQRLLEETHFPYLSIDHLKMGLIRSGHTHLTPESNDKALTDYLWPILREIILTAIENRQNLIIEGCYIPYDWQKSFPEEMLRQIRGYCLVMSEDYIRNHFDTIRAHANDIEQRLDDTQLTPDQLIRDNAEVLRQCRLYGCEIILIDGEYNPQLPAGWEIS